MDKVLEYEVDYPALKYEVDYYRVLEYEVVDYRFVDNVNNVVNDHIMITYVVHTLSPVKNHTVISSIDFRTDFWMGFPRDFYGISVRSLTSESLAKSTHRKSFNARISKCRNISETAQETMTGACSAQYGAWAVR